MKKPWRVYYELAYDGGGGTWHKDYRTAWGASIARLWNLYVSSWGGSAVLTDAPKDGSLQIRLLNADGSVAEDQTINGVHIRDTEGVTE